MEETKMLDSFEIMTESEKSMDVDMKDDTTYGNPFVYKNGSTPTTELSVTVWIVSIH